MKRQSELMRNHKRGIEAFPRLFTEVSKPTGDAAESNRMDFVYVTDWVNMTVEDPVLTVAQEELGDQEGRTRDELVRDILIASLTATHAAGGSNGNTPTEITKADIDDLVKTPLWKR